MKPWETSRNDIAKQPGDKGVPSKVVKPAMLILLFVSCAASVFTWNAKLIVVPQEIPLNSSPEVSTRTHVLPNQTEPIRFIAVAGLYHSGTSNMNATIYANLFVPKSKGINIHAFQEGYPPCGVPLTSEGNVDVFRLHGNAPGIKEQNAKLGDNWGVLWADWNKIEKKPSNFVDSRRPGLGRGMHPKTNQKYPNPKKDILEMTAPHENNHFIAWWKHTPPQHPMLACFRPDTLYVIMVRHPKVWKRSLMKRTYDLVETKSDKEFPWRLIRSNPRRLPPLDMRFKSVYHMWSYYMNGYLSWAKESSGQDCYDTSYSNGNEPKINCLGGENKIPSNKRNILIVRHEDYVYNPKKVLAQIFSFATRGAIDPENDKDKFVLLEGDDDSQMKKLDNFKETGFYSSKAEEWEGAKELPRMCRRLGYSCNESSNLFTNA